MKLRQSVSGIAGRTATGQRAAAAMAAKDDFHETLASAVAEAREFDLNGGSAGQPLHLRLCTRKHQRPRTAGAQIQLHHAILTDGRAVAGHPLNIERAELDGPRRRLRIMLREERPPKPS